MQKFETIPIAAMHKPKGSEPMLELTALEQQKFLNLCQTAQPVHTVEEF